MILFIPILLLVLFVWIGIAVRLIGALFSPRIRELVAARPLLHTIWAVGATLTLLAFMRPLPPHPGRAPGAKAQATIFALATACKVYYGEYETLPSGDNAAITTHFRGDNPRKIVFINFKSEDLNSNGEVIDPWGTPYKFTLESGQEPVVRSAGPNRTFGDQDDLTNH